MMDVKLLIGGKDAGGSGGTFERKNPVSGEVVTRAAAAKAADARKAVDAAHAAFPAWSGLPPTERRAKLMAAAARLKERAGGRGHDLRRDRRDRRLGPLQRLFRRDSAGRGRRDHHPGRRRTDPLWQSHNHRHGRAPGRRRRGRHAPWNAATILGVRAIAVPLAVGNTWC